MKSHSLLLALALLFISPVFGYPIHDVRRAEALLGQDVWTKLILVQNREPTRVYPATTAALVFEFDGILWLYTPTEGTQSLSQFRGKLEEDKDNLLELLKGLHRGFEGYREVPDAPLVASDGALRNGCLIESIAAMRVRIARGEPISRAAILFYYLQGNEGLWGHAVLAYEKPDGLFVDDASQQLGQPLEGGWRTEPLALARAYHPEAASKLVHARFLPVVVPASGGALLAAATPADGRPAVGGDSGSL
jgi:hypothetical protein